MRINIITLINFRQYKELNLNFSRKTDFDLHLILAENGIGKTTLLNAINWCLYGDEPHIGLKSQALPLINLGVLQNMKKGDVNDVSVKIEFEIKNEIKNEIITFERTWSIRKTEENKEYAVNKEWKAILCSEGKSSIIFENEEADKYVNRVIPKRIRKFFFFDGEQMDTYFADEVGINVEQSIFEISRIDALNLMYSNLKKINTDIRKETAKYTPETEEINKKYEGTLQYLDSLENNIKKYETQFKIAKDNYEQCCETLGNEPDIANLEIQRENLNNQIFKLDNERIEYDNKLKTFIKKYTILFNTLPKLKKIYNTIQEKEKNNQLPPKVDKDELLKMLKENTCLICGRVLDTESITNIKNLLLKYEFNSKSAILLSSIRGNIQSLIRESSQYHNERDPIIDNISKINDAKKEIVKKHNHINSLIEKFADKENIKNLYQKKCILEKKIKELHEEIIITNNDIKLKKEECKKYKEKLDKEFEKQKEQNNLIRENTIVEEATLIVKEIISEIKNDVREKISIEMNRIFFNLIWKKDTFKCVKLSELYSISLLHIDDYECLGSCSAAERELLALAFTLALHKESGFDAPLVIDTPISRISGELRDKFAKVLKHISEDKQIILYLTKDEYSIQVRDIFELCASNKHTLKLSSTEKFVEIEKEN